MKKSAADMRYLPVLLAAVLAAAVVTAVYWPARENAFVWDDWVPLVNSPVLRDPALWREGILSAPLNDPVATRPLAMLSFMLQLWAGQTQPAPFHEVNILLHAANVFLLSMLIRIFLRDAVSLSTAMLGTVFSALAYGLHPALTEPVIWISCRYDLLMTFFLLLALLFDQVSRDETWTKAVLVSVAFVSAVLSKETAVGFLLALPLVHVASGQFRHESKLSLLWRQALLANFRTYVALLVASVLYLVVRYALFGSSIGMGRMALQFYDIPSLGQRFLVVIVSLTQHVADAFWPFQGIVPSRSLQLPVTMMDMLPAVGTGACIGIAIFLATRAGGTKGRVLMLMFLAFIAALIPVSNFFPLPGKQGEVWVASRYLTFPLILVSLAVPFALDSAGMMLAKHIRSPVRLLWAGCLIWILASAANVRVTIPLWKDEGALSLWAIRQGARNHWHYLSLGKYHLKNGALLEARDAFAMATALRGDRAENWYYQGFAEALLGNTKDADRMFRRALEIDADNIKAYIDLAKLKLAAGDVGSAVDLLEAGKKRLGTADDPGQIGVLHFLLGKAYFAQGRVDEATAEFKSALALAQDPQERDAAEKALQSIALPAIP